MLFLSKQGRLGVCLKMMPHLEARLTYGRLLIAYNQKMGVMHATQQKETL